MRKKLCKQVNIHRVCIEKVTYRQHTQTDTQKYKLLYNTSKIECQLTKLI